MFRTASRLIARPAAVRAALPRSIAPARRHLSTAPPTQKSRSWKSLVARFGVAGTIIYYYNTTDVFAEEPRHPVQALPETEVEPEHLPTIESISAERQKRKAVQAQLDAQAQQETQSAQQNAAPAGGAQGGIEGLEEEADQQGAFNPETGEINWDCPCLGGMAHGPCGEQFRAAFSCFVYSSEEPKGMDCIDRFKDMQNCFRQYPEVYGSELESDAADDEDDLTADAATPAHVSSDPASKPSSTALTQIPSAATSTTSATSATSTRAATSEPQSSTPETGRIEKGKQSGEHSSKPPSPEKATESRPGLGLVPDNYKPDAKTETGQANQASSQVTSQEPVNESESLVPKAAFDAADGNAEVLERK